MPQGEPPRFACDAMHGALSRWLRAAGYDAFWQAGIPDWDLVRHAAAEGLVLLSSDTGIFRIGIVRDGEVRSLFIPHGLTTEAALAFVLGRLNLPLREPRCMACGGALAARTRDQVAGRVPPRSLAAAADFRECTRCARVFWQGTHWERIAARLRQAEADARNAARASPRGTEPSR